MIVPGTTIGITLKPGFIEIRDKGIVRKKIALKKKSFDDVLKEVEFFFKLQGKILAPYVLKDILIKIGLPRVKVIIEEEFKLPTEEPDSSEIRPEIEAVKEELEKAEEPLIEEESSFTEHEPQVSQQIVTQPEETGQVSMEDFEDIQEALMHVDQISDSFMTSQPDATNTAVMKPEIRIHIEGTEEIQATSGTSATKPKYEEKMDTENDIPVAPEDLEEASSEKPEPEPEIEWEMSPITADGEETAPIFDETQIQTGVGEGESVESPAEVQQVFEKSETDFGSQVMRTASQHLVKPLLQAKVLMLGEEGVGKSSLIQNAGLESVETDEGYSTYQNARTFETTGHRVKIVVWSFDEAVRARVTRTEYYHNADVILIVYSTSDRWSFESIDFWLREAQLTSDVMPPLVIVGNKKDLRVEGDTDSGDEPVSTGEGFRLAEYLSKSLGTENKLHPVAFLETSCLTLEGVEDVFITSAELFVNNSIGERK